MATIKKKQTCPTCRWSTLFFRYLDLQMLPEVIEKGVQQTLIQPSLETDMDSMRSLGVNTLDGDSGGG